MPSLSPLSSLGTRYYFETISDIIFWVNLTCDSEGKLLALFNVCRASGGETAVIVPSVFAANVSDGQNVRTVNSPPCNLVAFIFWWICKNKQTNKQEKITLLYTVKTFNFGYVAYWTIRFVISTALTIGQLHDDDIWLQLPELVIAHVHVRYALLIKNFWQFRSQDLRWLDWIFLRGYLPSLSINHVAMSKGMGKRLPQLYYIKTKISYDLGFIAIGVAMAT